MNEFNSVPESIAHISKPIIIRDFNEAPIFTENVLEHHSCGYVFPFGTDIGRITPSDMIVGRFYRMLETFRETSLDKSKALVISSVNYHGDNIPAFLVTEAINKPYNPYDGFKQFYRFNSLDTLSYIAEFGYYQLPGRKTLYDGELHATGWLSRNRVAVVFNMQSDEIMPGEFNAVGISLPQSDLFTDTKLPDEIIEKEAWALSFQKFTLGEEPKDFYRQLETETLMAGNEAGILVHIPPERLNLEATIKANENFCAQSLITPAQLEALKYIMLDSC